MEMIIPPLASSNLERLLVPIDLVKMHPENYKDHPDEQLDSLIASLASFGWTKAICADKQKFIVSGHGMYLAAKKKGYTHIPVAFLDFTENQSKAYLVADNETARKSRTNHIQLKDLLGEISLMPEIDDIATGFDATEIDLFVNIDDNFSFDAPEPAETKEYESSGSNTGYETPGESTSEPDGGEPEDMVEVEGSRCGMSFAVHVSFSTQEQAEAFLAKIGAKTRTFLPGKMSTMINGDELEL